jgi:glycerol-3-phosphate responsive antiterminator
MTITDRKEHSKLHYDLITMLANCETDMQFLKRLLWAKTIINNALTEFTQEEKNEVSNC